MLQALLTRIGIQPGLYADRAETRRVVSENANITVEYLAMNSAASLIAGYGLLSDSVAVVIGAMLIAMLYGPILSFGMALAEFDPALLRKSLYAEAIGAVWVFSMGCLLGLVHSDVPIGEQILQRTAPNILDLMIALSGGAAGAYAIVSKRISGAVVGVAIATALAPPLVACGILVSHGLTGLASGAFLLFFANFSAIAVAAMGVFLAVGHRVQEAEKATHVAWSLRLIPLAVLILLSIQLVSTFRTSLEENSIKSAVETGINRRLTDIPGARLVEVSVRRDDLQTSVYAVIRSLRPLTTQDVAALDASVDSSVGRDVALHVRVVIVSELTKDGEVVIPAESRPPRRLAH